jgi:hypothetical protein
VRGYLGGYKIDSVIQYTRPLKDYGEFCCYDPPCESMPRNSSWSSVMVLPAARGGRYGLVPMMKDRLEAGCILLVDDVDREQEMTMATRWSGELGASFEIVGTRTRYIEMRLT